MRPGLIACLLLAPLLSACKGKPPAWEPTWRAPYGEFEDPDRQNLVRARRRIERGRSEAAWRVLHELNRANPDNLEVGRLLQDVQLALIAQGSAVDPELAALGAAPTPEEALRRYYRDRAEEEPSVPGYVLAARLETDEIAAVNLLERARALDPKCAWAYYGLAHAFLGQVRRRDRWRVARDALAEALRLDPAHIAARRLDAWMLGQEGETGSAIEALRVWLEVTRDDPRVGSEERVGAEVDLATLLLLVDRTEETLEVLGSLEGVEVARPRRLALLAVARHERGDLAAALDAAQLAQAASGDPLLALVQEALLAERGFEDSAAAERAWDAVREEADSRGDLSAILQGMRARVALERMRRAAAAGASGAGASAR